MAQYLTAQWDYIAEGNYELSFKEGDKIKLLEKHNDDWWEGELNDEIGFFPANRAIPIIEDIAKKISTSASTPSSSSTTPRYTSNTTNNNNQIPTPEQQRPAAVTPIYHSNPYLQQQQQQQQQTTPVVKRETVSAPIVPIDKAKKSSLLVDISTDSNIQDDDLPPGWRHFYDNSGTIYFFNETTKQSQWEKPTITQNTSSNTSISCAEPAAAKNEDDNAEANENSISDKESAIQELAYDIKKLNLDALHPNWIRIQSIVQMKIVMDDGTEISWRDYYAVLATGYLLIYKEGLNKTSRRPNSFKSVAVYGTIDLESSEIVPANKSDTRKKNAFIITSKDMKIFVSVGNETLYSEWLDAIMRELISKKEDKENQDEDLVQLLASIPLKDKTDGSSSSANKSGATVAAENAVDNAEESKSNLKRWFSKSSRNSNSNKKIGSNDTASTPPVPTAINKEIFGGYLKLEEDGGIPLVVRLCVEHVDKRGLDVVGIYRLSGQSTSIQKYKSQFNTGPEDVNLDEENDINVITGLLKLYFRELKNPLLTFEYYDRFIEAARLQDYDERMFRLKSIIQVLPVANYKVFQYLVRHLERVKNQSDVNKMEASNLALIFSIGLLRSKQDDLSSSIMHSDLLSKVVETILQHVDWFFDTDTDDELLIEEDNTSSMNNSNIALS